MAFLAAFQCLGLQPQRGKVLPRQSPLRGPPPQAKFFEGLLGIKRNVLFACATRPTGLEIAEPAFCAFASEP